MSEFLIVAAVAREAAQVDPCWEVLITGIGKTAAAARLARALTARESVAGLTVLNIGTAGALRGQRGLFEIGTVLNHDVNADLLRSLGLDPRERLTVDDALGTVLATGDGFVADPVRRDELAQRADLVDMEGYALAWVCAEFGVPLKMAKYVSDGADADAVNWADALDPAAEALAAWVCRVTAG